MKYSRQDLLVRLAATRDELIVAAVDERTRLQRAWDAELEKWQIEKAELLADVAYAVGDRARDGLPVSYKQTNRLTNMYFRGDEDRPADLDVDSIRMPDFVIELSNVLESMTDDAVSSTMLENAGVLRHLRYLVRLPKKD